MVWAVLNQAQGLALKELIEGQKSDRIVAVVGGAILDDSLRRALELRLRQDEDMNEKLFRPNGPLGNLQPKIDLAYQLYMFEKPLRNTLYGLAEIRNLFAHQLNMHFSSPSKKMKDAIAKLKLHEGITHYPSIVAGVGNTNYPIEDMPQTRDLFFVNLKLSLTMLMADAGKHKLWSNNPNEF
jgi:hypothetical protein